MNPYTPTGQEITSSTSNTSKDDGGNYRRLIGFPSAAIITLAFISCCIDAYGLVSAGTAPGLPMGFPGVPEFSVLLLIHLVQLVGGFQMRSRGSYWLACVAALTCCIPCVSPFVILGLPFGTWALSILCQPEFRAEFTRARDGSGERVVDADIE